MNWGRQLINNILTNEKYVIMEFSEAEKLELASDEEIARISERLISKAPPHKSHRLENVNE